MFFKKKVRVPDPVQINLDSGDSIVIEIHNNCCYAYYLVDGQITGDVWLFNIGPTPKSEPWKTKAKPPFQNPDRYCREHSVTLPIEMANFATMENLEKATTAIYYKNKLVAILWDQARPGKSAFAKEDSPVAHKMTGEVSLPDFE